MNLDSIPNPPAIPADQNTKETEQGGDGDADEAV